MVTYEIHLITGGLQIIHIKEILLMASITLRNIQIQDPPLTKTIFSDSRAAWFWVILRVWLGYQWIEAAMHKIGVPAWTETGAALQGFWSGAVAIPAEGRPPITFDWYRSFIHNGTFRS